MRLCEAATLCAAGAAAKLCGACYFLILLNIRKHSKRIIKDKDVFFSELLKCM